MPNIDTKHLEAEISDLDEAANILCDIQRRGGKPKAGELLKLRCLAASHARWLDALIKELIGELKEVFPARPTGSGARGSDGGGPYTRR